MTSAEKISCIKGYIQSNLFPSQRGAEHDLVLKSFPAESARTSQALGSTFLWSIHNAFSLLCILQLISLHIHCLTIKHVTNRQSRRTRSQGLHRLMGAHHSCRCRGFTIQVHRLILFRWCYNRRCGLDFALGHRLVGTPLSLSLTIPDWFCNSSRPSLS